MGHCSLLVLALVFIVSSSIASGYSRKARALTNEEASESTKEASIEDMDLAARAKLRKCKRRVQSHMNHITNSVNTNTNTFAMGPLEHRRMFAKMRRSLYDETGDLGERMRRCKRMQKEISTSMSNINTNKNTLHGRRRLGESVQERSEGDVELGIPLGPHMTQDDVDTLLGWIRGESRLQCYPYEEEGDLEQPKRMLNRNIPKRASMRKHKRKKHHSASTITASNVNTNENIFDLSNLNPKNKKLATSRSPFATSVNA